MKIFLIFIPFFLISGISFSQQITGYWQGKLSDGIKGKKLVLKIVLKGDSLVGTSYYYESKNNFKRYSIKGYFNEKTNAVIWWDDQLIESKQPKIKVFSPSELPYIVEADFNCPGGGIMMLDGKAKTEENDKETITLHLDKKNSVLFEDEWDVIIDNWMVGGNSLQLIDSVQKIAFNKPEYEPSTPIPATPNENLEKAYRKDTISNTVSLELPVKKEIYKEEIAKPAEKKEPIEFLDVSKPNTKETSLKKDTISIVKDRQPSLNKNKDEPILSKEVLTSEKPIIIKEIEPTIEKKFVERKKVVLAEIPIADSIELHFYDNAEVDGDSISLFLNNQLLFEHIRLSDRPHIIKLNKEQLANAVELTMVAENLGSIPPNTSYMIAFVNGKRFDATLSSTEKSSAVIRFSKK